jgi:glucose-6-phosphate isomerase
MMFSLGSAQTAFDARLRKLDAERFAERLWAHDDSLWGDEPERRRVAANRLGWLDVPAFMRDEVEALHTLAISIWREGFTHAVLLGMGGSSLAPEVLRLTFGVKPGAIELAVLDNTSPAAVRAIADGHDPKTTLFLVSSKSGSTLEVTSFEKYFYEWVRAARGAQAGRAFVAITDPSTSLEKLAVERGYRRVCSNPPDIGGRYSALSYFGLVPASLIGVDTGHLLDSALAEAETSGARSPASQNPGVRLGAALGELALAGRDKLTLVLGGEIEALGSWIEQLVAESTGKIGRGIVPVAGEPLGPPSVYGNDRVFVAASVHPFGADAEAALAALAAAGHPILRWTLPSLVALGAEFLRWEIATATAGAVLDVNPFDEPNVTEAKNATGTVLASYLESGQFAPPSPAAAQGATFVEAPPAIAEALRSRAGGDPAAWVPALLALSKPGDYVALLAYLHRTPELQARLETLRVALRNASRLATTTGFGPRFLHSTGQLHKGGPNTGLFVQITGDEGDELMIPGEKYGFGALRRAQAAGDYQVLVKRERRVIRVHLGGDPAGGLDALIEAVSSHAAAMR